MSINQDRPCTCAFFFADGRRCQMPPTRWLLPWIQSSASSPEYGGKTGTGTAHAHRPIGESGLRPR